MFKVQSLSVYEKVGTKSGAAWDTPAIPISVALRCQHFHCNVSVFFASVRNYLSQLVTMYGILFIV